MAARPYKTVISVPADSIDLTRVATVKADLGVTDGAHDADMQRLVTQMSQAAATYCNRVFASETVADHFRLQNEPRRVDALLLSRFPVGTVTSVVEDGVTLTAADYEVEPATGFLWRLSGEERSCWASAKVVVTYAGGYALLDDLPHDIERAVIVMVKQAWFARNRDPMVKSMSIDGVSSRDYWIGTVPGDNGAIPAEAEALLDFYRVIPI